MKVPTPYARRLLDARLWRYGGAIDPLSNLIPGLRDGDPKAAEAVFARFAQKLTRFAEQHLSAKLAGRLDGSDVVQSVFRTFFHRSTEGEFKIDSTAQLWQLLVKITLLKARAKRVITPRRSATSGPKPTRTRTATDGPSPPSPTSRVRWKP